MQVKPPPAQPAGVTIHRLSPGLSISRLKRGARGPKHQGNSFRAASLRPSVLQKAAQGIDFLSQRGIGIDHALDLAHGMEHGRMIPASETPADLRQ